MKKLIIRCWKGELPFWDSFWLLGVVGSLLYIILAYIIIKYAIPAPPILKLNILGPLSFFHAYFTIVDAKQISLPYFIAGIFFIPYAFIATVIILRQKIAPQGKIIQYLAKLAIACVFCVSVLGVTEIGELFFGITSTNSILAFILSNSFFNQTIFMLPKPYTVQQYNATQNQITQFTEQAVLRLYTYDYKNYAQALSYATLYFSKEGWERYRYYMHRYSFDDLAVVERGNLSIFVSGMDTPKIMEQGDFLGRHFWVVYAHSLVAFTKAGLTTKTVTDRHFYILISQDYQTQHVAIEGFIAE